MDHFEVLNGSFLIRLVSLFFLADQNRKSRGPKKVRGPDSGKHWCKVIIEVINEHYIFLHKIIIKPSTKTMRTIDAYFNREINEQECKYLIQFSENNFWKKATNNLLSFAFNSILHILDWKIRVGRHSFLFIVHHRSHRGRSSQIHRHTLQNTGKVSSTCCCC